MLTVADASKRTGRNPETIRRWIREGKLPAQKVGTLHMIDADDLARIGDAPRRQVGEVAASYSSDPVAHPATSAGRDPWLPAIVGRIVRAVDPVRIGLFGDRARGEGGLDATYEVLVVLDDVPDRMAARVAIRGSFADIPVAAEISVASTRETEDLTGIVAWALADGHVVYDRESVG